MRAKILILSVLLIAVLVSSGCVDINSTIDKLNLIRNPEKYYNQEFTITSDFPSSPLNPVGIKKEILLNYEITERDEEGKPWSLPVRYEKFYCLKCQITGTIKRVDVCTCQYQNKICDFLPCKWLDIGGDSGILDPGDCAHGEIDGNISYFITQCDPESYRYLYYFYVTGVKSIEANPYL